MFTLCVILIILNSADEVLSDNCLICKSLGIKIGRKSRKECGCLIVEVALIADVCKRLHNAFPLDLAVIGQSVGIALAVVIVNVSASVNKSGTDRADSLCGVNALEQAVSDVEANGEYRIVESVEELVESLRSRGDRNSADVLDCDLDSALASDGDELFIEIEVVVKKDLGVALDGIIEMCAGVNNDHRRAEIRRVFDTLNDLLEALCGLFFIVLIA